MMKEEQLKKKKSLPIVVMICVTIMVIAIGSYALWQMTKKQSGRNVVGTACLSIDIEDESGDITLENQYPMSDADGANTNPYTFTVTNNCDQDVNYIVALESLPAGNNESSSYLDYDYIRVKLDNDSPLTYGSLEGVTNDNGVRDTKEITHHTLGAGESVEHSLRIWVKEDTPLQNEDESYNTEKYFYGKVKVLAGQGIEDNGGDGASSPAIIGIVSGDINTVGSEVKIGDEHFYVIGDDEETSGNVKLLAKYNLLVGESNYANASDCEEAGGVWSSKIDSCNIKNVYNSDTPGYNRQSSLARGDYCLNFTKHIIYENVGSQEICEDAGGDYDYGECEFATSADNVQYDNLTSLGTIAEIYLDCEEEASSAVVYFSDSYKQGHSIYWVTNGEVKEEYSLHNNQNYPYVYYDHSKNTHPDNVVAPYVIEYKNIIEDLLSDTVSDARLMSIEELLELAGTCVNDNKDWYCLNPSWIDGVGFWLGSAYSTTGSYSGQYVYAYDAIDRYTRTYRYGGGEDKNGIRPVISVSKSLFN